MGIGAQIEDDLLHSPPRFSARGSRSGRCGQTPPSCGGHPFQRHEAANVVGQVLQADLGARSHNADRAHDPAARRILLRSEHMLDARADSALGAVRSRLRIRQRMVAAGAPVNTAVKAAGLELRLALDRAIGAVGEHITRGVALGQERVERLAVVYRRIGHLVAPDQLVLGVRIHMVLA
jgi:hypothetical protein